MRYISRCAGLTLVCLLAAQTAAAQEEALFPDKALEAVVRQYVFEKRNNEMPLVEDDVKNISTIVGKNKGIKSLQGLEKCRSLALLDLAGNEIEDLTALKELTNLQSLDLSRNKIQDIQPLTDLTGLQYLHLAENLVADLAPLAKMANLRSLYLSNNKLQSIEPVSQLTKLWSLYLDGNPLADLKPVSTLHDLTSLDLRGCGISDLSPLSEMTELKYLILDNNNISDLSVLVAMAKKDFEGEKRFAPFLRIYLSGNPLSDEAKSTQIEQLKQFGCRVELQQEQAQEGAAASE